MGNTMHIPFRTIAIALALGLGTTQAGAGVVVWGGADAEYTVGGNWVGGSLPDTFNGDTAQINGGAVTYTPGGDLHLHSGGVLQINGGSWTQDGGVAWIQMAGGVIDVAGGIFSQGTAGNIIRDAASIIQVSAGSANLNDSFIYDPVNTGELSITGGTVNVANEFKPIDDFTMSAGTLNIGNLISFADGPGSLLLMGGTIVLDGSTVFSGFYGGDALDKSLNFSVGSTGTVRFENYTIAELNADGFLSNNTIQYDGANNAAAFSVVEENSGVTVTLVPEPASLAMLGMAGLLVARRRSC